MPPSLPARIIYYIDTIRDPKYFRSTKEVFKDFMGPLAIEDPYHVRLQETGLAMAWEVFYPPTYGQPRLLKH